MQGSPASKKIEADISRLETGIRELKVQYDMFLAGALPREPFELRHNLERLIKRYANAPIRKYHHRFHFNALVARYHCLAELWGKNVRAREEGDRGNAAAAGASASKDRTLATCRIKDGGAEMPELRRLHAKFVEARQQSGAGSAAVPYEAFARRILAQAQSLRQKSGCADVELRVEMKDEKVVLKARPGR